MVITSEILENRLVELKEEMEEFMVRSDLLEAEQGCFEEFNIQVAFCNGQMREVQNMIKAMES